MVDSSSSRNHRRLIVYRIAVCVFWLSEFVATHAPLSRQIDALPGTDKHLHFGAYFVLGGLLMFWNGVSSVATGSRILKVILILAAYAAADELLQPLVARDADLMDWVADVFGAAAGAVIAYAVSHLLPARWSN